MKLLTSWGITNQWWLGLRGEYWIIAQGILLLIFALLPTAKPSLIDLNGSTWQSEYANYCLTVKKLIPGVY